MVATFNPGQFQDQGRGRGSIGAESVGFTMGTIYSIATRAAMNGLQVSMREAVETAAAEIAGGIGEDMKLFSQSLRNNTRRNRDGRVTRINQIAGQRAQEWMVRAYALRHPAGPSQTLERSDRQANGAMRRALRNPGMVLARWDGVSFVNRGILDATARQWYRLNFGAGRAGRKGPQSRAYPVEFFGSVAANLSLGANRPSPDFVMPTGFWMTRGRAQFAPTTLTNKQGKTIVGAPQLGVGAYRDEFIPAGRTGLIQAAQRNMSRDEALNLRLQRPRVTRGIVGSHFMDVGVRSLARNLGTGWNVLIREWFTEAALTGTGPVAQRVDLTPGGNIDISRSLARIVEAQGDMTQAFAAFSVNSPSTVPIVGT